MPAAPPKRSLAEVARRLPLSLRAEDTVGRLAGDEFLVVCEALTGSPEQIGRRLRALGERIRECLAKSPGDDDLGIEVSVSIGAAVATARHTAQEVIGDADRAMYAAKRAGGGCFVIAGPEVASMADFRRGQVEAALLERVRRRSMSAAGGPDPAPRGRRESQLFMLNRRSSVS